MFEMNCCLIDSQTQEQNKTKQYNTKRSHPAKKSRKSLYSDGMTNEEDNGKTITDKQFLGIQYGTCMMKTPIARTMQYTIPRNYGFVGIVSRNGEFRRSIGQMGRLKDVTNMSFMFWGCREFNQDLSSWA